MEYDRYDEKLWQPEILKKKERSIKTIQKYAHLVFIYKRLKEDALPDDHSINLKLRECKNEDDYLKLKFTAEEAAWILCLSFTNEIMDPFLASGVKIECPAYYNASNFLQTSAYDVIWQASQDNDFIYKDNENGECEPVELEHPPSRYFSSDENTIMDIALRLDELILEEWEKQKNKVKGD